MEQKAPENMTDEEVCAEVLELLAWKRDAIARFPDLAKLPFHKNIEGET